MRSSRVGIVAKRSCDRVAEVLNVYVMKTLLGKTF
jgi:hypothetical protein